MWLFAGVVLFSFLGSRELWTQEGRWAATVGEMILRRDYLHPYLISEPYYDKPLLSYWLVVLGSYLTGGLNEWVLRLPSAVAGLVAVWSTHRLAILLISRKAAFVASWMLVTTVFFVFWSRVSSADMLNAGGIMLAVLWYFEHRDRQDFLSYAVFFILVALTSLTKGLVGAAVPAIVLIPELCSKGRWKKHLNSRLFLALIPGLLIYLLPFAASSYFDEGQYGTSGISRVINENVTRYFQPFDHKGPIYTYLLYLPLYLMPWILFFAPAVWYACRNWKKLSADEKWPVWATILLFLFFTASGSRRSYYILPVVPFATLVTAAWVARADVESLRSRLAACLAVFSAGSLLLWVAFIQPVLVGHGPAQAFGAMVRKEASKIRDWADMPTVMSGGQFKMAFYLNPARPMTKIPVKDLPRVMSVDPCRVIVSQKKRQQALLGVLGGYKLVEQPLRLDKRLLGIDDMGRAVALIPTREMCEK